VAIDPQTAALLVEDRQRREQRCGLVSLPLRGDRFVFSPEPDASAPYGPRSLGHRYRRLAIKLGLRSTRLHSLRHYSATELIAAGVDVRTVAGRLGHGSGGATTLKVYAAWVDQGDRRAATTMAGLMPAPVAAPREPRGPYEVVAAVLREQIVGGQLRAGDQLPTIAELRRAPWRRPMYAHRAIDALRSEGLIAASRGRRATVVQPAW
jgi:integrase